MNNSPPEKYWQLLELALADFDVIRQDPRYEINMMRFHDTSEHTNVCFVCLAGAVMARTLHAPPTETKLCVDFPTWQKALYAISNLALGCTPDNLDSSTYDELLRFQTPIRAQEFHDNPIHWRIHMDKVVQWLKERNL